MTKPKMTQEYRPDQFMQCRAEHCMAIFAKAKAPMIGGRMVCPACGSRRLAEIKV